MLINNVSDEIYGDNSDDLQDELLVSGWLRLNGSRTFVKISRGMTILTTEGDVAGTVAGIIHEREPQQVKYILLSRLSQEIEYQIVPVELVQQVSREAVVLHILAPLVNTLPRWNH